MKVISADEVHRALKFPGLIDALQEAYSKEFSMPPRQVFLLDDSEDNHDAFAVLPSWNDQVIGVKAFTYFPKPRSGDKSIYSQILLFNRANGEPVSRGEEANEQLGRRGPRCRDACVYQKSARPVFRTRTSDGYPSSHGSTKTNLLEERDRERRQPI